MSRRRIGPGFLAVMLSGLGVLAGYALGRPRVNVVPVQRVRPAADRLAGTSKATRNAALRALQPGEPGTGGYYGMWDPASKDGPVAHHIEFQYAGMEHQSDTALSGMWLFLVTELLFFGGLFFLYLIYRSANPAGVAEASRHAELLIGTINTALLLSSSAIFSHGLACAEQGRNSALFWACVLTALIGIAFLALKGYEWHDDLDKHLFPGPGFSITGPNAGTAQLFWCFYFVATGLHGLHLIIGIGLVAWIAWSARSGRYSPGYFTPVEAVGLYWSFVDMVWLVLYPTIYLAGRIGS